MQIEADPLVVEALAKAAKLTQLDKDRWTIASHALIRDGVYQRLSEEGAQQAVDNIAYRIACRSFQSVITNTPLEDAQTILDTEMRGLDDIMIATAFGSSQHIDIIEAKVAVRVQEYVTEMMLKLPR